MMPLGPGNIGMFWKVTHSACVAGCLVGGTNLDKPELASLDLKSGAPCRL